ncbi:hypothetical protein HOLleu_19489 [Holothuria leucospilota]|uniref:Uncharacterized protein n=1 Tax=Holothuria leucospilota TaxID=206669 RepID=A0A9Q1BZC5_HOLLE|nr:hypothetical protein HOLleu_19489 [Holothuria leucospilota]
MQAKLFFVLTVLCLHTLTCTALKKKNGNFRYMIRYGRNPPVGDELIPIGPEVDEDGYIFPSGLDRLINALIMKYSQQHGTTDEQEIF